MIDIVQGANAIFQSVDNFGQSFGVLIVGAKVLTMLLLMSTDNKPCAR
jgi:hypothetical protein